MIAESKGARHPASFGLAGARGCARALGRFESRGSWQEGLGLAFPPHVPYYWKVGAEDAAERLEN